jgi:hypothetical protein
MTTSDAGRSRFTKLLLDDLLRQAWRLVGFAGEPALLANDYGEPDPRILPALGQPLKVVDVPSLPDQHTDDPPKPMPLTGFLQGTCIVVNGTRVSRRELISWTAITLGRKVHYAPDFERAISERRKPFPQLLEIGMALLTSPDVRRLHDELASHG